MANQRKNNAYEEPAEATGAPLKILGAVACFGLALLMLYITVAPPQAGTAMGAIRDVMRGLGGGANPVMALVLVWVGVLLVFSARGRRVRVLNVVMNALLFLCVFTAVQLFSARTVIEQHMSITTFANFVSKSYQYGRGGGAIGALLAYPLYMYLGQWGGLIVTLIVALLCLMATGRAQKIYRWTARRADEGQHRAEQRRNEKKVERLFEYDEFSAQPPVHRAPRPQSQQRPARRAEPEKDYMVIDTPAQPSRSAGRGAQRTTAPKKRMYRETIDGKAAGQEQQEELYKPLRRIKKDRQAAQAEAAEAVEVPEAAPEEPEKREKREKGKFPRDIPDYLSETGEEKEASAPQEEESETFAPRNYESPRPKKRTVVEGVRALDAEDGETEENDDEPPFDIPLKSAKPARMRRTRETEDEDEEGYNYPPIDLLEQGEQVKNTSALKEADRQKADKLIETLESFGIETRLIGIAHGPAVTRFELQPAPGVKVSRITALADDIALGLAALSVRIEAPIPGKAAVGVEIPNDKVEMVRLRDVLESPDAKRHPSKIAVGLGKDNSGRYIVADIAKMPHVLIAGQTGSGKSVCINSIISSILYRATPEEVRMILIDPKVVELSIYNDIPHLIAPVVTDPKKASSALEWAVAEMSTRYKRFAERGVRDIKGYNKALEPGEKRMPQMVIVIDELADLMMVCPGEVEDSICRLAQLARAAGMHLVIATQRPSVNVITGVIKANIPTRIAFSVASQVDSRTMIDHGGAEKLLGNGDMLFVPSGINKPIRVQGAWVSDEEVHKIVTYIKERTETTYDEDVVERIENAIRSDAEKEEVEQEYDPKLAEAVEIVVEAGQASVSMLQRRMRVGYARAGRLIDEMERRGVVSEADGAKPRSVLITREQMNAMFDVSDEE